MKVTSFLMLALISAAHAELKWESTSARFTYVRGEKVMRYEFAYTNVGKETVSVTEVTKGCACCTSYSISRKVVKPGSKGVLKMKVDVSGKELPLAKPVVVTTDDGKMTPLVIHVDTADGKPVKVPLWGK